ncbi:MAG TPA: tRNA epoxyqueuosine(34) reductase QueG [Ignavibacteriaceae bacterium]|jgi:epoxyqueuosine reductase|nr:MAG: Epoxyqueuosine reductase [Ignavibacteria bacterium ADurb.Bin266]OQY71981.1 MAG: tRNA epoxyqueuosine(34) reductase QueG [Ignavibacteriales bacterium UTCHB2]HQF41380.1 tRNA epoxyqueuosine(34) reductase QueG [Ignavibacteriaceae bacterium]HQI41667.1 tRNA epoxyqueuosine(34) reductase QueG [Ignavibacteriaceae bacterium]
MSQLNNQIVIEIAKQIGFDLVGFAQADLLEKETKKLQLWLDKGYQATMGYMERNFHKRKDVREILPSAKSVISLALNYYTPYQHIEEKGKGKVSRYGWGKDYHFIMWEMLEKLENELKQIEPELETKSYVDTGPVMDKVWAVRSGLGWRGKHTCVINPNKGSWFFIAEIITNWEFEYSEIITDHCGTCTACIDACPTGAIVQEYVVDANKCISFQTIENKGEINPELKGKFENWLFGCDICQDVCPWNNKFSFATSIQDFYPKNKELSIDEVLSLDNQSFKEKFAESPIMRSKLKGLQRNAQFLKDTDQQT